MNKNYDFNYLVIVKFLNKKEKIVPVIAKNHSEIIDYFSKRNQPLSESEYFTIWKKEALDYQW